MNRREFPRSTRILVAALVVLSLANAAHAFYGAYHWPLFVQDEVDLFDQTDPPLKVQLRAIGVKEIAYRIDRGYNQELDGLQFYILQLKVAPVVLRRGPTDETFLLMNFRSTGQTRPLPGFRLIEDFGNGLALFRKN